MVALMDVDTWVTASRAKQGLGPKVTNERILERLGVLYATNRASDKGSERTTAGEPKTPKTIQ